MAAGEARRLHAKHGRPVMIVDRAGRPTKSELWVGVPYITQSHVGGPMRLLNCSGTRPYIAGKTPAKWVWQHFTPTPAEIVFTPEELAFAEPYRGKVMIEPNAKNIGHWNKAWPRARWLELSTTRKDFVQCGPTDQLGRLTEATHVVTPSFRHALAVLSVSRAFVGTEGGLMHGAAAVGTPAVILWSEFISPDVTGYKTMTNLRHAGTPCGKRTECHGCRKSLDAISVNEVSQALERILE